MTTTLPSPRAPASLQYQLWMLWDQTMNAIITATPIISVRRWRAVLTLRLLGQLRNALGVIVPVSEIGVPKGANSNILAEDFACVNLSADGLALQRNCRFCMRYIPRHAIIAISIASVYAPNYRSCGSE